MSDTYTIEVKHLNWSAVIGGLIRKQKGWGVDVQEHVRLAMSENSATFEIDRSFLAPEKIAAAIGATVEQVVAAPRIELTPLRAWDVEADWQKPTVDYTGDA